jgi:hypothetical protein
LGLHIFISHQNLEAIRIQMYGSHFRNWAYISGSDLYLGLLTSGGHQNLGLQISGGHQNLGLQISRGSGPHNLAQRYLEVNRAWA